MKRFPGYRRLGAGREDPGFSATFAMARVFLEKLGIGPLFLAVAGSAALVSSAASSLFPLIGRYVIDEILMGGKDEHFWTLCIAGYGAAAVGSVASVVPAYLLQRIEGRARIAFNTLIHEKLMSMPFGFFQRQSTGALLSSVRQDLQAVFANFSRKPLFDDVRKTLLLFIGLGAMLWLNAGLGFLCIGVVLLTSVLSRLPLPLQQKLREERIKLEANTGDQLTESLLCVANIKASGNEKHESRRYRRRMEKSLENELTVFRGKFLLLGKGCELARRFLAGTVGIYGTWRVLRGDWTLGSMTAFFVYYGYFNSGASHLVRRWLNLRKVSPSLARIHGLLQYRTEEVGDDPSILLIPGDVVFHDVDYSYDQDRQVLRGISFTMPAGRTTALVGPNGAGKTTVAKLLFRFMEPDAGCITVGGRDIRFIGLRRYQKRIGIVLQDGSLFNRTLYENIEYGRLGAEPGEVHAAARKAGVPDLPQGFDTRLGERGAILSAGQRQRVALAREIVHDPALIILDEASSALDTSGEECVHEALEGRTTLLISHRPSVVRKAHHIVVLDGGAVEAEGSHEYLLATCALYQEIVSEKSALFSS